MNYQPQNSSGGGNQRQYTNKSRGGQGVKKQQDKQPQQTTAPKVTGWGDLYANVDNTKSSGGPSAINPPKEQKFKPFVPGANKGAELQQNQNEMNDLQKMISDSSQDTSKAESMRDQDDAILSIDQNAQKPLKFSNKNQPKNKRDPNFAMMAQKPSAQGQKKERQLEKTHASWVSGTDNDQSLNDLMRTDEGSFDQFAGKKTTYDERAYGYTTIDESKLSKAQIDHAKKVEKEILSGDTGGNIHLAEERGHIRYGQQEDEEIQYSGVIRNKAATLKNHKKFLCFNKKATGRFENKVAEPPFQGLLNINGWEHLAQQKQDKQSKQNQVNNKSSSQSHSSATKAEGVTGVYKGGGSQQISNTQTAYIKQQVNNSQQNAPSMKIPTSGFTPSAKPFVPKNIQPFQPKEESKQSSQTSAMTVNQPSFTPKSETVKPQNEPQALKSESQAFTPQSEQTFNEFKPNQSYNNYTPKNAQSQSQHSQNQSGYQGNQSSGYQNRQNNQYQQKQGNQYNQNQNSQYQGNNFQQPYSGGNQMYQQKHNNYQNNSYGNYDNYGYKGQNYGQNSYQGHGQNQNYSSNSNYQQNNQQNQQRSVNNPNQYYQNNFQNTQQQWGQGNLYYMQNQSMEYSNMNNNYNQSHGSQGQNQNVQATGGFQNQNNTSKMSMTATVFKPNWQKD